MTPDDILNAFISAGLDTPEKVSDFLSDLAIQNSINDLDIQIESVNIKQAASLQPFNDQRTELTNQRAALVAKLSS